MPKTLVPSPGITLKAGERVPIFAFDTREMDAYFALLDKVSPNFSRVVENQFMHKGIGIPVYIRYLSLDPKRSRTARTRNKAIKR
jgi:hypothetical protein